MERVVRLVGAPGSHFPLVASIARISLGGVPYRYVDDGSLAYAVQFVVGEHIT
jgi:hypothetical protein